jgi:hypothetical protein
MTKEICHDAAALCKMPATSSPPSACASCKLVVGDLEGSLEKHRDNPDDPLDMNAVTNFMETVCEALAFRHLHPKSVGETCEKLLENHDDTLAAALLTSKASRAAVLSGFCKEKTPFCPVKAGGKKKKKPKKKKKGAKKGAGKAEL